MFQRSIKLTKNNSFFLFGPRGSGKSTLVRQHLSSMDSLLIDLLESNSESRYWSNPDLLYSDIKASKKKWILIDEVQKIPKLLDIVQKSIEELKVCFVLTGSSARKLKRGGANLLAGRAFLYNLFPLTHIELGDKFDLHEVLAFGSLPKIFQYSDDSEKIQFLNSYTHTYLKEEILAEQIVRNANGFRSFLEVAAQMNGKLLNYSKVARESGVDHKTVQNFYQILEDTLVGFTLPGFHKSIRKAQTLMPKFYFFDLGVQRALERSLKSKPVLSSSVYGFYFGSFVINEIYRQNIYTNSEFKLSHYNTSTGQEVDLVLSTPKKDFFIEIKSATKIDPVEVQKLERITEGLKNVQRIYLSQDPIATEVGKVKCLHWSDFVRQMELHV